MPGCRRLSLLAAVLLLPAAGCTTAPPDLGVVPPFTLTERSGRTVTNADLLGKVWVASFVFTRCTGPCPQVTLTMQDLQRDLAGLPDVRLVTFTVDPERDDAAELQRYAAHFEAHPERWLFLTGEEKTIHALLRDGFMLGVERNKGEKVKPGEEYEHSTRLVVVDRQGHIRGYFSGFLDPRTGETEQDFRANLQSLRQTVEVLEPSFDFPRCNAGLNSLCTVLLILGYLAIRRRLVRFHIACMLTALVVSAVFLASYLYYHFAIKGGQPTRFPSSAPSEVRLTYFAILISHTLLAVAATPLALTTVWLGYRGRLARHVRLARWTLPIWLYVSITGVVVYVMLYRLYPPG